MGETEAKAVVRGYMENCLNRGNLHAIPEYFHGERVLFNGEKVEPRSIVKMWKDSFPDVELGINHQIVEGDIVVTLVTLRGTHQGTFYGIAPTGQRVEWTGVAVDCIENGKVVEMRHWADELGLLLKLGAKVRPA